MKKILLFTTIACSPFFMNAQCLLSASGQNATCFGICNGSGFAIMQGGTGPYTYLWMPGNLTQQNVTGLCAGTYTVTGTDASLCSQTVTVIITQPTQISVIVNGTAASCSICCDGMASGSASGGTPAFSYMWTGPNSYTSFIPSVSSLCPGSYTFCVTDANGCISCSPYTVTFTSGIQDPSVIGNLSIYPSPASDNIALEATFSRSTYSEISLANVLGQTVYTKHLESAINLHETIDLSALPNGVYFVSVKTNSGTTIRRFIKE